MFNEAVEDISMLVLPNCFITGSVQIYVNSVFLLFIIAVMMSMDICNM